MHGPLVMLLVCCLAISFLMSGMEAGVFALSRLRVRQQVRAGNRRAQILYDYLENPESFLWTILVGNTVANVTIVSIGLLELHRLLEGWRAGFVLATIAGVLLFYSICE